MVPNIKENGWLRATQHNLIFYIIIVFYKPLWETTLWHKCYRQCWNVSIFESVTVWNHSKHIVYENSQLLWDGYLWWNRTRRTTLASNCSTFDFCYITVCFFVWFPVCSLRSLVVIITATLLHLGLSPCRIA